MLIKYLTICTLWTAFAVCLTINDARADAYVCGDALTNIGGPECLHLLGEPDVSYWQAAQDLKEITPDMLAGVCAELSTEECREQFGE